jgi:PAS domain S-box-containing protein
MGRSRAREKLGQRTMSFMPSLSAFRAWSQDFSFAKLQPAPLQMAATADGAEEQPFPSTARPTIKEQWLALAVVLASLVLFVIAVPFARVRLPELWAFIPVYQSALAINDLVTATLLFAQFSIMRSRALLVLACGYLFTCAMVVVHGLTFPGLFSATGLLGAGPQTTAWLYAFWHLGFPIAVIAYARLKDEKGGGEGEQRSASASALYGIGVVCAAVVGVTLLATSGQALLPEVMRGSTYAPALPIVVSAICLLALIALVELWRRPRPSTIDLWLMVTMCAWIFDIALSALLNGGRFDLGFYAGRLYGLMAATFVLIVLLTRTTGLYARLSRLLETEQLERRREAAMRRRIFDTSLDLILIVDRQGNVMQASPSTETILGYDPASMAGRSAIEFLYREDLEKTRNVMRRASRGEPTHSFDCRYVHKDGRIVPLSWKGVWSEPDQQHFFVGRDMTERVALEQQLRQAQKMEAIGQLTGGIAHDFNNILAVIIGMTELTAVAVAGDAKVSAMVKQIDESAERGAQLVQRMLAFARRQPLEPRILDMNTAVQHSVALLERTLGEHITLQAVMSKDLWPALADQAQLEDAIVNLALNARDAMPEGGRLVIETSNAHLDDAYAAQHAEVVAGDYVAINVTDSGAGIPPELIERVFEPFFTTKEVGRGTGLGLSMVYGFVKQSRGHVKIYSEIGHGTSVRLYFPRAMQQMPALADTPAAAAAGLPAGREAILVVEDDAAVRGMAVGILEGLGYHVQQASDGKSALGILREGGPVDLLFTDMIMPNGMNGHDLIAAARRMRPGLKVLLTSGYSEQFIKTSDSAPNVRLLNKPYRRETLATVIRAVLEGNPASTAAASPSPTAAIGTKSPS